MGKSLLFGLVALFMFWQALPAHACSCAPLPPVEEALAKADAVFAGKVVHRKVMGDSQVEFTFRVSHVWKGITAYVVRVVEASSSAMCGYGFELGAEYLVYAYRGEDGTLSASICSRTKPVDQASEEMKDLDN